MKKYICILLAIAIFASFTFVGCGTKADTSATPTGTATEAVPTNPTEKTVTLTTVPATVPTTAPTAAPTQAPTTAPTVAPTSPAEDKRWNEDKSLKILAVGNSFSIDCMQYVYKIAKANGVENVKLGNLYIAGCALDTHLKNAQEDEPVYKYYSNDSDEWNAAPCYAISTAVQSEDWDFIIFQQASPVSGYANTYDDLAALVNIVEPLCTNKNVKFAWHMTWAYQADSTNSSFNNYSKDQTVMYNAITSAVKQKIATNAKIASIIPNGTVIQNARTSYVGDTLTRDGYHLSKDQGRKLAGLGVVNALIGINWETADLSSVITDEVFLQVAIESVQNAAKNPYSVTPSAITVKPS